MHSLIRWLPTFLVAAAIYHLSGIPNLHIVPNYLIPPDLLPFINKYSWKIGHGGFFSYVISFHPDFIMHKIGHIVFFGLLGSTLYFAVQRSVRLAWLLSIVIAASDEFHQYYVVGRSSRFGDIVLDSIAALCAILIVKKLSVKWKLLSPNDKCG